MSYDPDFAKLLNENIKDIISNPELIKQVGALQRDFTRIKAGISGIGVNLQNALNYVRDNPYHNIEIGNEQLALRAKEAGYSQADFEKIQEIYDRCLERKASSIPRVSGEVRGKVGSYNYEMLRLEDPLALTVGTMTDCCQEIHGAGETSMLHSVLSEDGRVFVVRDEEGRIVAQSWVWRNGDTICFDNIEIPELILKKYAKESGREALPEDILKVYEDASQKLMQEDKAKYDEIADEEFLEDEKEQVVAGKVTVGIGYNDIKIAIEKKMRDKKDKSPRLPQITDEIPHPYTDAETQYIITERKNRKKENLFAARSIYDDEIKVYDDTEFPEVLVTSLLRMEEAVGKEKLKNSELESDLKIRKSPASIIEEIAYEYNISAENTRVLATPRTALIIEDTKDIIKICECLKVPLKEGITEEQAQKGEKIINKYLAKSIEQLMKTGKKLDMSMLDEEQQKLLQEIINDFEVER